MDKINLEFKWDRQVAVITLNDGKGNILDAEMMGQLQRAFQDFRNEKTLKLIRFEGAGKHFSFGASVEEHRKEQAAEMLASFHGLFYSLMDLSVPTMALLSGQCLGGGMELAIACHILFADSSARLGQPEIVLGVFPPPASVILPLKIGQAKADELLLTGRSIRAEEACQIGLVQEVFEDRNAMVAAADEWIEKHLLPKSATSLRFATRAARSQFNQALRTHLPLLENLYVNELMETPDANEGITSFLEKRPPQWSNG